MTIPQEFKYNPNVKYGILYLKKNIELVNQTIFVNENKHFPATFPDLFQNYQNPTLHTNEPWNTWLHSSFDWWQCQLNFAVWCASAGCGVSYQDHLQNTSGLTKTVYIFHLYYCIARILKELKTPLPTDTSFCYYKNPYDKAAYQKLCNEFNVSPDTDWRQKLESSSKCHGLGQYTQFFKPSGEYRDQHRSDGPFFNTNDKIEHTVDISNAWTMFILDKSKGFTQAGIVRINESIRMFVWAILAAQSQTRVEILKLGTGFDAQKQFIVNIQDAINSPIDLPSQISRYQNTLKYARSKVDFVFGIGLYMSPSDLELQIGTIADYNNEIVIATGKEELGFNTSVNAKAPPKPITKLEGTPTRQAQPAPDYYQKYREYAKEHNLPTDWVNMAIKNPGYAEQWLKNHLDKTHPVSTPQEQKNNALQHEDNKTALIVGSIVLGFAALLIYEIY